ncbi:hypothetical protein [Gorillibacterium sp. CAU 1737]|uniref:hypothetical protein n=1 Tax=Gorillibacterium sp. CAU 1737 TaxID=3140362 RepID=UPI003261C7A3
MTKKIQAYFQTESDALSANTKIQAYGAEYLEVSELPENLGGETRLLIPYAAGMQAGGTPGSVGGYAAGSAGPVDTTGRAAVTSLALDAYDEGERTSIGQDREAGGRVEDAEDTYFDGDRSSLRYVMAATVKDKVYRDVVRIIRESGGYVEVFG